MGLQSKFQTAIKKGYIEYFIFLIFCLIFVLSIYSCVSLSPQIENAKLPDPEKKIDLAIQKVENKTQGSVILEDTLISNNIRDISADEKSVTKITQNGFFWAIE